MNTTIHLNPRDAEIIQTILKKYPYQFYAFGSRVGGTHKKFSDLDVCYKDNIPNEVISQINAELEDSDISIVVDLVNWHHMPKEFKKNIAQQMVNLN